MAEPGPDLTALNPKPGFLNIKITLHLYGRFPASGGGSCRYKSPAASPRARFHTYRAIGGYLHYRHLGRPPLAGAQ
jgi:hypothetical protein